MFWPENGPNILFPWRHGLLSYPASRNRSECVMRYDASAYPGNVGDEMNLPGQLSVALALP